MIKLKKLLAENMRRFGTKNLTEQIDKYYWTAENPKPKEPGVSFTDWTMEYFPYMDPVTDKINQVYDLVGKPINFQKLRNSWMQKEVTNSPKVSTTWFEIYKGKTSSDGRKIVGYHKNEGVITDPLTGEVLFTPGPGMKPEKVYQWLWDQPGEIVGDLSRKNKTGM